MRKPGQHAILSSPKILNPAMPISMSARFFAKLAKRPVSPKSRWPSGWRPKNPRSAGSRTTQEASGFRLSSAMHAPSAGNSLWSFGLPKRAPALAGRLTTQPPAAHPPPPQSPATAPAPAVPPRSPAVRRSGRRRAAPCYSLLSAATKRPSAVSSRGLVLPQFAQKAHLDRRPNLPKVLLRPKGRAIPM
jgi:hypothetical protein